MRAAFIIFLFIAGTAASFAGHSSTSKPPIDSSPEIRAIPQTADRAVITYVEDDKKLKAEVLDSKWFERFAVLLEATSLRPHGVCFCIFYPQVEFFTNGKSLGTISLGGGSLNVYTSSVGGNFSIDREIGNQLTLLIMEKRDLVPPEKPKIAPLVIPKVDLHP